MEVIAQTFITHTYNSDLEIYLISPAGTRVTLSTNNGGLFRDGYDGTYWFDHAGRSYPPGPITLAHFPSHTPVFAASPEEALSAFNGEDPNGVWQLVVVDDAFEDTGVLDSWSLDLTALNQVPASQNFHADSGSTVQTIPDDGTLVHIAPKILGPETALEAVTVTTVITHPEPGDLVVSLVPPDGYTITLSSGNGLTNSNAFAGTVWSDKAGATNPPGPVTDNAFISGTVETPLVPQEPLGSQNDYDPAGSWSVVISDTNPDGQTGQLGRVSLDYTTQTCLPDLDLQSYYTPLYPRLASLLPVPISIQNVGAPASGLALTSRLSPAIAFHSLSAPGWSCPPVVPGSLGPTFVCSRASLAGSSGQDSAPATNLTETVKTFDVPDEAPITLTVSSINGDFNSANNSQLVEVKGFAHSANGNPWDVADQRVSDTGPDDSGAIGNGGQFAFGKWGSLKLRIFDGVGALLTESEIAGFGLAYSPGHRWRTTAPQTTQGVQVARGLFAPDGANWLRYVDTFTNVSGQTRVVVAGWGGLLGSNNQTQTAATSNGDPSLTNTDTWAVTTDQANPIDPATQPPVGFVFRSPADASYLGPGSFNSTPFTTTWPSSGEGDLAHTFKFSLAAGTTARLAYFVYRGLAEGVPGPQDCQFYGGCVTPVANSQVTLAVNTVTALAANPPFCDLSPAERASIVNWPGLQGHCVELPITLR